MKKRLLTFLLVLSMLLPLIPTTVFAEEVIVSGKCGKNITWKVDNDYVLTISGSGDMTDYDYYTNTSWIDYRVKAKIKNVIIQNGVVSIGDYAFYGCESLTSITIPDSVTSIGEYVFYGCKSLTSITIPDSVTSIGDSAFCHCESLTSVTIPDRVTSIGDSAFGYCTSLTSITIPDSVTSIGVSAFDNCTSLISITIPDSVTSIGHGAFRVCSNLVSITIPDSVTSIGEFAFGNCESLTSITIPNSVTSIGYAVFTYCTSLTSITIPNNVTRIGEGAFYNCDTLTDVYYTGTEAKWNTITIDSANDTLINATIHYSYNQSDSDIIDSGKCGDNVTWMLDGDGVLTINGGGDMTDYNYNGSVNSPWYYCREKIKTVIVQNGVTSIGDGAFFNSSNLTSVTLPDSIIDVGKLAFDSCISLPSIIIPNSVVSIGASAFGSCTSLISITIPDSVTCIEDYAFYRSASMTSIIISNSVISIGKNAFYGCYALTDVYYIGLQVEWNAITIGSKNDSLINATIHYNYNPNNANIIDSGKCGENLTWTLNSDGVLTVGGKGEIVAWSFANDKRIRKVVIENGVTGIGEDAFLCCYSLATITIPNSVTSIGNSAFHYCESLTSVAIPASVTTIGECAFSACKSLVSITVDINNKAYHSIDNCIVKTATKTIIAGCTTSIIPRNGRITSIGDYAFLDCYFFITSITIPDSVTTIGANAFTHCGLTSITIPDTVTSIGDGAFHRNYSLAEVYYTGTETEWNKISVGSKNDYLLNADIHYNVNPKEIIVYALDTSLTFRVGKQFSLLCVLKENGQETTDWSQPAVAIGNGSIVSLVNCEKNDLGYTLTFNGKSIGTTTVSITDCSDGTFASVNLTVAKSCAEPFVYTVETVPSFFPDAYGDTRTLTNFYNINGIYVRNFPENPKLVNGKYHLSFDVYNTSYMHGSVDVYNAQGEWIRSQCIDKYSDIDSVTDAVIGTWDLAKEIVTLNESYTATYISQHTPIDIYVPEGGYIVISNNMAKSPGAYLYNAVDLMVMSAEATLDLAIESTNLKNIREMTLKEVLKSQAFFDEFYKQFGSFSVNFIGEVGENSIALSTDVITTQTSEIFEDLGIDFWSIVSSASGIAENLFVSALPPIAEVPLELISSISKFFNVLSQTRDICFSFDKEYVVLYTTSSDHMIVEGVSASPNEGALPDDAVMKVFRVSNDEAPLIIGTESVVDTYEVYNISFVVNNSEVQPNGYVTVRIPLPDGYSAKGTSVLHEVSDGVWETVDSRVENGYIVFEVNHFSNFAVAHIESNDSDETTENTTVATSETTSSETTVLDTTPTESTEDVVTSEVDPNETNEPLEGTTEAATTEDAGESKTQDKSALIWVILAISSFLIVTVVFLVLLKRKKNN